MGFINYDELSMQTKKNDDKTVVYADSTELQPDMGGSAENKTTDDSEDNVETNERLKNAQKIVENINTSATDESPSEQLGALKQIRTRPKSYAKPRSDTCSIKEFPRELIQKVRAMFPGATNNTDALSAFVVTFLGEDISVSDTVDNLVAEYNKNDPIVSVNDRLHNLERQSRLLVKGLSELELGLGYMIFDRLGYRNVQPVDARNADMLESNRSGAVMDIIERMREQAAQMIKQENIKNGRPIR